MRRSSELLKWTEFKHCLHYDETTDTYLYDPEMPQWALDNFVVWAEQFGSPCHIRVAPNISTDKEE